MNDNVTQRIRSVPSVGRLEDELNLISALALGLVCVITLLFNLTLIYIIARTKSLHTPTNCIIVSLACSDLMVGMFVMPVAVVSRFCQDWMYSPEFCQLIGWISSVGNTVTVLSMMVVAIDRYIAVSKPLKYSNIMSALTTGVCLGFIWLQSVLFSTCPFFGWGFYYFDLHLSTCSLSWNKNHQVFFLTKSATCVIIPCLVICVTLFLIFKAAKSHHRIFTALPMPFTVHLAGAPSVVNYKRSTLMAMRALFFIILTYLLLWTPFTVISVLSLRGINTPTGVKVFSGLLTFASSAVNPLIITALNKKFKEKFKEIVCCQLRYCCHDNRVVPESHDRHTNITGIHSTYGVSRAGPSNAQPPPSEAVLRRITRPIVRLQPPTPIHSKHS